jgi:putative selenate reductase molybdopterin-binding subunit
MKFQINGEPVDATPQPGQVLRTLLRDLDHFEVKKGCDAGDCGACTVLLNDEPIHSCIYPAHRLEGARVTTVSGLGTPEQPHPLQQSFVDAAGFQCGFCTAGMIVTASTFAEEDKNDLPRLMKGNICRCTGYRSIKDAICGHSNTDRPADGASAGSSVRAPAGMRVVTGTEPYTLDVTATGLLHLAVLGSPHPHARILSIDTSEARALPGVQAVLTHEDSPKTLFSTGRHEHRTDDPDDTRVLDTVLRFRGQRVAAVVADTVAIAQRALDTIHVEYELLPAIFDADAARAPGAPLLHGEKGPESRIANPSRNIVAEMHGEAGDTAAAIAAADAVVSGTWQTQRVSHAALETHATRGWKDKDGRLVLRTSSQVPYLVRDEICHIFDLERDTVRVFTGRVGGGFGGKQELLTEDIVTLAVLATGRAVQYEFTREDEFTIAPTRHPMRLEVTVAGTRDGLLTALVVDELMDTGAYGNHGIGVMFHSVGESLAIYRCANKKVDTASVYTNNLPSGAFRGYGLGQVVYAVESAIDDLARKLGIDPYEFRRRNAIVPGDPIVVTDPDEESDLGFGSYGLDQCLDLAETAMLRGNGVQGPDGWPVGTGMAMAMIASMPPRGHFAETTIELLPTGRYSIHVGTAEFGNGTTTVHAQLAATALNTSADRMHIHQSDTDVVGYDTGAFGSAGVVVAGKALYSAARLLSTRMLERAAELGYPNGTVVADGVAVGDRTIAASTLLEAGPLTATGRHDGTPRSIAFNVHAFRVAVNPATGEVRILQSVQSVDAGTVLNPEQLRGQIEGGTAQAIGSSLYEEMTLDNEGRVLTTALRNYHVPQMADVPDTEVYIAVTHDEMGPLGAKSMSEAPYNPVAPALANAVRDALGVRPHELPMSRDRIWRMMRDVPAAAPAN